MSKFEGLLSAAPVPVGDRDFGMMAPIVSKVTLLTKARQVQKGRRFGPRVEDMSGRQDDDRSRHRMGVAVFGPAPFATAFPPDEPDEEASQFPVGGIAIGVFGFDRHGQFAGIIAPQE